MPGDERSAHSWDRQDEFEAQSLLPTSSEQHGPVAPTGLGIQGTSAPATTSTPAIPSKSTSNGKRHSSISMPTPDGQRRTPRTANRVRFDLDEQSEGNHRSNGRVHSPDDDARWLDEEDYELGNQDAPGARNTGQAMPLLTNVEAPSVAIATSDEFFAEEHLADVARRGGMRTAFMNMVNIIVGAGIIGQPYAIRQAGLATGLVLLAGLTVTVDWTIRLIVVNSKLSGADSVQATMQYCFGKGGLIAISITQWAFAFGAMVAYCVIVGDTIPRILDALFPSLRNISFLWLLTNRQAVIIIFVMGFSYPLSLYRDIAKLATVSTLALASMLIIVVTIITQGFRVPAESQGEIKSILLINSGFFQAVGVISFAFVCHHSSLMIYGSLQKPTLDRFATVTHYSTGVSSLLCVVMGVCGFLAFGSKTQGNILNNFPSSNVLVNIARLLFGLNMLTTLPLEAFVCRAVMTTYYYPDEPYSLNRHVVLTTSLVAASVVVSLITCDLGLVFELIGATSAAALAFIFPPLCYIKLSGSSRRDKLPAYICVVFGFLVMVVSVVQTIANAMNSDGGGQTCGSP
ncbi:hypothetical protein NUU61_009832 [Penicillium alfredii]|uniref:Amino acid transporter transmembrane domain-containing protein n=1 Tax=Penicillium alfredii TaxID=1506179 RepID=A0A9W9JTV2_9EURO|nr:uncharacterized protein NUU61_009832 [Penicillium alfredii]KAJ5081568.1 hypothetical protein NUU61_009832 [Penicillium alfredii]